jgi:ribose 5-phosphate isomerase B
MRIAIGSDHRGYEPKGQLAAMLRELGHHVIDVGTYTAESCDYPDFAAAVGRHVAGGQAERGLLICGTAIGMCIAANKIPGVRAGVCNDEFTAEMSRRHNDLNVLCLSEGMPAGQDIERLLQVWLNTEFEGGRHARRVEKIKQLERESCG